MKARLIVASLSAIAMTLLVSLFVAIQPAQAAVGMRITNGRLVEANGTPFIMRGINHAHAWYPSQTSSFANIKALGANTVRVVLSGGRWTPINGASDVANVISLCKANRLICVLENHDTTGFGEQSAVTLDRGGRLLDQRPERADRPGELRHPQHRQRAVRQQQRQPGWTQATTSAISRLRNAGFEHTIMVDAPNWGQDWQFIMRDNAPAVFDADPTATPSSRIHMYGVFDTAAEINAYLDSFRTRNLPLVHRRVRVQPLRRQPGRGHHHGPGRRHAASATSAGRGAATAAASSTSTW